MQKGDIFPILKEHTCQKLSKRKTVSNSSNNPQVLITSPWSSEKAFWNILSFSFVELKRRALIMRVLFRVCSVWKLKSAAKWFIPGGSMSIFQTFPKLSGIIRVHTLDLLVVARIPAATCRSRIISSPTKNWKKKKKERKIYSILSPLHSETMWGYFGHGASFCSMDPNYSRSINHALHLFHSPPQESNLEPLLHRNICSIDWLRKMIKTKIESYDCRYQYDVEWREVQKLKWSYLNMIFFFIKYKLKL